MAVDSNLHKWNKTQKRLISGVHRKTPVSELGLSRGITGATHLFHAQALPRNKVPNAPKVMVLVRELPEEVLTVRTHYTSSLNVTDRVNSKY